MSQKVAFCDIPHFIELFFDKKKCGTHIDEKL